MLNSNEKHIRDLRENPTPRTYHQIELAILGHLWENPSAAKHDLMVACQDANVLVGRWGTFGEYDRPVDNALRRLKARGMIRFNREVRKWRFAKEGVVAMARQWGK